MNKQQNKIYTNIMNYQDIYENYNAPIDFPHLTKEGKIKSYQPIVKQGNSYNINWRMRQHVEGLEEQGLDPEIFFPNIDNQYGNNKRTMSLENGVYSFPRNPKDLKYDTQPGLIITNLKTKSFYFEEEDKPTLLELYQLAIFHMDKEDSEAYIVLYYENDTNNNIRNITINQDELNSYEEFIARKEYIESGQLQGSDALQTDNILWKLSTRRFGMTFISLSGFGETKSIFKCEDIIGVPCKNDAEKGNCGFQVVMKILQEENHPLYESLKDDNEFETKMIDFNNIFEFLRDQEISIATLYNHITIKLNNRQRRKRKYTKFKDGNRDRNVFKLKDGDWEPRYIDTKMTSKHSKYKIIYDDINQHFDLIIGDIEIIDELYLSKSNSFYNKTEEGFKEFRKGKENAKKGKRTLPAEVKYIFFDFETIVEWERQSGMKAYSVAYSILSEKDLLDLEQADKIKEQAVIKSFIEASRCYIGWDCISKFVDEVLKNQDHIIYKFVSFNGVNFDNYILLEDMLVNKKKYKQEYNISDIFYNGSQLLNFKINKVHTMFDVAKHLVGSLDSCCKSFGVNCVAKTTFDHYETQCLYDDDKENFIKNIASEKLIEYNKKDVLSLAVIFQRYRAELISMPITREYGYNLANNKTIGRIIWKVFNDYQKKNETKFPKFMNYYDEEGNLKDKSMGHYYDDLNRCKIAGRVELFNGPQEINETMASLDICSLYPYVLSVLDAYFPCGKIKEFQNFKKIPKGKMYFQYVDIDQTHLKEKNLPQIYASKSEGLNNWDKPIIKNYLLSNIMIDLLDKYGCITDRRNGFYFTEKKKNYEIFGFLLDLMEKKNEQDKFKREKSELYNACLRETMKLLSNAISGKVIEGLHCDKTEEGDIKKYLDIKHDKNTEKLNTINVIGDKIFYSYSLKPDSILKEQRPIYLGILCYDYSRRYMYEYAYSKTIGGNKNNVYTDTDALKARDKHFDYDYLKSEIVPHWKELEERFPEYKTHPLYSPNSKVYGSFENELSENDYFACFQKKSWICCNNKKVLTSGGQAKASFKGVGRKSILLYGDEDLYDKNNKIDQRKANKLYNESKKCLFDYNNGIDNYYEFSKKLFDDCKKGLKTKVLCMSFRKVVKNSLHNVEIEEIKKHKRNNYIKCQYSVKNIKIKI